MSPSNNRQEFSEGMELIVLSGRFRRLLAPKPKAKVLHLLPRSSVDLLSLVRQPVIARTRRRRWRWGRIGCQVRGKLRRLRFLRRHPIQAGTPICADNGCVGVTTQSVRPRGSVHLGSIVTNIRIEVPPTDKFRGVFADEPPGALVIVSGTIEVKAGFAVELSASVAERVAQRTCTVRDVAEGVVRVGIGKRSGAVAQRCDRPESVRLVIIRCAAPELCRVVSRIVGPCV